MMPNGSLQGHLENQDTHIENAIGALRKALTEIEKLVQDGHSLYPNDYIVQQAVQLYAAMRIRDILLAYKPQSDDPGVVSDP